MPLQLCHKSDNGDIIKFLGNNPILLSYNDLLQVKKDNKCNISYKILPKEGTYNNIVIEKERIISMLITPDKNHHIYALAINGWLPLSFIGKSIILADRNFLDIMKKIRLGKKDIAYTNSKWWINFLSKEEIIINPVLYASEGEKRILPSFEEFCRVFKEGTDIIQENNFKTVLYNSEDYNNSYKILKILTSSIEIEISFLLEVVPLVVETHSAKIKDKMKRNIDNKANKVNLPLDSLVYHLVIMCLKMGNLPQNHARKVLKPKKKYTENDAYNTLMDLLNLKVLLLQKKFNYSDNVFLCTADFHLASFLLSLNIDNIEITNENISFDTNTIVSYMNKKIGDNS